jgi:2-oxoacid:acceptor oxidoreductase gamma subunit (pyruvate/2-ketoisovalerate family)
MIGIVVHGRGGQGGVTLAKLIAGAFFLRGLHVQAFGMYGAERTGAPIQAFVRVDEHPIAVHTTVTDPDHIVIVDPTLVAPHVADGMRSGGWIVVNSPCDPAAYADVFAGRNVATVDAGAVAVRWGLGTSALPIVNTALLGAVARVLRLSREDVLRALSAAGLAGANVDAAQEAFAATATTVEPGEPVQPAAVVHEAHLSFLDDRVGRRPTVRTGAWASVRPFARELRAACADACPAGNDVRGFVQAAAAGDDRHALDIILETSPFPAVCGRVCPAPCMAACNRGGLDGAVDVRDIERGLADRATGERSAPRTAAGARSAPVAVIGSGPAGLSAAYHLARLGHAVELLEGSRDLGGALRSGIPEYRLPRDVLDREIAFVLAHGIVVRRGVPVDRPGLEALAAGHAAVIVATGMPLPRDLPLTGERSRVRQALDLLAAGSRRQDLSGETVVVAGGGTTAVDAARTALRLGAREVHIAYRRTRDQMPAIGEEVEEALEEGVVVDELLAPVAAGGRGGRGVLTCRRMRLGAADQSGRPRPEPVPGAGGEVEIGCDLLLLALGETADFSLLPASARPGDGPGRLGEGCLVFTAGDLRDGAGTVAAAIGSGRRAALAVHAALSETGDAASLEVGRPGVPGDELAGPDVVQSRAFPPASRQPVDELPARARRLGFAEVRRGFAPQSGVDAVRAEAARCFACGHCTGCDLCVAYCPEGVLRRAEGHAPEADLDYCKGCGLCAVSCPRGALRTAAV